MRYLREIQRESRFDNIASVHLNWIKSDNKWIIIPLAPIYLIYNFALPVAFTPYVSINIYGILKKYYP